MRSKTGRSLKKFLSFLLTLSMVLGMLPTFALAGDLGEGTADHLNYTFDLLPHDVLKSDSTDTTDVDAVITIYGDGDSSVDALDLTVKLSVTPTLPVTGAAREVTLVNVSGDSSNYAMTTGTTSGSDFTVQKINGAIVVTMEKVMTGVSPAATIAADFKVTVGGSDVVTKAVSEQAGLDVKHLLNDGSLYAAVTYDAPPTPIGKTVDLLTYVDIYTNAGGGTNATFSLKLGTDDATISKVNHATNGMITNSLDGYAVSNNVEHDVDVYWHRAGDRTVKNVLRSRGFFEWQTALKNLRPGDNAVSYILDDEGNWYTKNVGDITVHVPTCAVNVPSAVVSTADLVVTYRTEVKNGSVAVVYNGKTFTTGTDVDLSDGVAKITIPKADLDTGWTSLYAVQTTESGVKSVPADATLNFVDEAFDVTFKNGTAVHATQTVAKGGYASRPSDPTATGQKFVGWVITDGSTPFNFNTKITEPTTVYARFVPDTTTTKDVNFYVDSTVYETQTVVLGGYLSRPTDPVKPGYMFVDWVTTDGGDTPYDFSDPVNSGTGNAYAKFASTGASRDVIFYWDDGTTVYEVQHVANGGHAVRPATPVKAGYEFVDWYVWTDDGDGVLEEGELVDKFNFGTAISADGVKAYAKFKEVSKTYTVTYLVNGEYYAEKTGIAHNGTVPYKPASPKVDGYTFDGWYKTWTDNGDGVVEATELADEFTFGTGGTQVTADTTLYAKLTKIGKVTVTFDDGDTSQLITVPDNVIVDEGSSFVISNFVPERAGYIFKGWKEGTNTYAPGATYNVAVGATSVTLTAQWVADLVTVTAGTVGTGATLAGLPTVAITRGTEVAFTVTVAAGYDPAALVVKANGVALAYSAVNGNVYHYSFVANADTTITVSDLAELSYTVTMPVGDNFTAEFTDHATSKTVTHGDDYSFVVTPDAGYNIKGVYVNGVKQTATSTDPNTKAQTFKITNVTGPQTIEVSVDEIPVYTVTYVVNNAQYTTQKVSEGAKITTLPEIPVIDGYTFNGWFTKQDGAGTEVKDDTVVSSDMTVYARLTAKTYTITYNGNGNDGGTVPGAQTKTHGIALNLSTAVPTRTGYKFLGWGTSASATVVSYQPGQTYSADENLNLYAVWEQLTFTVTLPSGTGFTVNALDSTTVAYGGDFEFQVIVDRAYAKTAPVVEMTPTTAGLGTLATVTGNTSDSTSATWTYKITGVKEDKQVAISVTMNPTHVVTFKTWLTDVDPTAANTTLYMTQKVENGYPAAQPAAPVVEGYTFGGWVWDHDADSNTAMVTYEFTDLVNKPVTIVAKMLPIVPVVSWTDVDTPEDGWDITVKAADVTLVGDSDPDDGSNTVKYGSDMTFTVTIGEGWDASKMAVGANGLALAPVSIEEKSDKTVVYTYNLVNITADTAITVSGVERKTVTITFNANARDDVSGMPEQQVVKYYVAALSDNDQIVKQYPVRTGYEFLGWSTNSEATAPDTGYDKATIAGTPGAYAQFTKDTTLYAIWKAEATTVTLTIQDYYNINSGNPAQYEGQKITLVAEVKAGSTAAGKGTVTFYKKDINSDTEKVVGSPVTIVDGKASLETTVGEFVNASVPGHTRYCETYWAVFTPEADEGYATGTSANVLLRVYSSAISWKYEYDSNDDLTIYQADKTTSLGASEKMVAGQTYWLKLPDIIEMNGGKGDTSLTPGTDYIVEWQYQTGENSWTTFNTTKGSDAQWVKITPDLVGHVFHALVIPNGVYTKAATYGSATHIVDDVYASCLTSDPTAETVLQTTTTTLDITGADNEDDDVVINGANNVFTADHWAQYEGQTVTLEATVKETTTGTPAVTTGYVNFYRYVATGDDELLNTTPVAVGANGVATFEVTISDYSTASGQTVLTNVDRFYAVYLVNDTYDTSASVTKTGTVYDQPVDADSVYIKSTAIKTPIIDSVGTVAPNGKLNDAASTPSSSTSYDYDLIDLLAGVEHKFTLRTTGAAGVAGQSSDWSVVALDGREVASTNYDIVWNVKTGDNTVTDSTVGGTFVTSNNKVGDEISVTLIAKNDMKVDATSKKAIIGTKQDVTVTVTAEDVITSTAVDRANGKYPDVYQLNKITLTATVAAAANNATMQPSENSTVAFYYKDSNNDWIKLGEAVLTKDTDGQMRASITTTKLPVDATNNTKRDVEITAVYLGDETFKVSGNYNETTETVSAGTGATGNGVTDETVTVYSSVVYVDAAENTTNTPGADGITISAEDGQVLANETNVNLKLSDVYTLDHDISLSKLAYGVDYTVQWQKLSNAASYASDYADEEVPWQPITSANGTICQIDVEDGAAYRAVITVTDTPIAKGSYTEVDQDIDGRRVYYSNILVASDAPATVTVNVNTSNVADGYEGIVEGETVTIHTFTSGATGTTPISELTMVITDEGGNEVDKQVKTNVNGHVSFDWVAAQPGYYTLTVNAKFTNGYSNKTIVRELIVRDDDYSFTFSGDRVAYNGKAQGLNVTVDGMGIESGLAQKSVVVYYYDKDGKQVEPTQAGTYTAKIRLQESAYWTEKTMDTTFTIAKRQLSIEDVIVQAKVYDGTTTANVQEIILKDAATNQTTGLPNVTTGVINGDSVYVTGTAVTNSADVKDATTVTVTAGELQGDDAANYELQVKTFTESFKIQRSQVQGDIADATYKYGTTGVPAEDIYLIDQAGTVLDADDYTVTYYYHSGNGVKQVSAMNWKGMYTVIARPDQNNYKGGASQTVYVADAAVDADPVKTAKSALISITNTVELFGDANNQGIQATATKGTAVVKYNGGGAWVDTAPTAAGRYLVKVTAEENSAVIGTAYGLYTVVKTYPDYSIEAADADYNSAQYAVSNITTNAPAGTYFTYTGGTIQGVAYEAPTEVGTYVVTAHIPESDNTVAHEFSDTFEIKPIALKITADSLQRRQYGAFPDMTASFDGLATGGVAADTSLRDVQIQPELIFNETDSYDNIAMDHVGNEYPIIAIAALARNYDVSYVNGNLSVTRDEPNPYLAIHGMIDNGNGGDIAYYGDVIQLYAYGSQMGNVINNSSVLTWKVTGPAEFVPDHDGLLKITGVGTVVVTLKRGIGAQQISTTLTIDARKQEVKVVVPSVDLVYTGADRNYSGVGTPKAIDAKLTDVAVSDITVANNVRGVIGGQIVTGVVVDDKHQSETYGGLFTINDAEIVVAPKAVSTTYGTAATMSNVYDTGYTETTRVAGGTAALTGAVVASIADAYNNLDASTYEILVAGTEDMNYNVKYTTNPHAEVVTVTALENTLKYTTGVIAGSTGRTSGSAIDASGFNPDEGAVVTYADPTVEPNDRMYGEPNPAMNYLFNGLIAGDSAADLVELIELVGFVPGIDADANRAFMADASLTGTKSTLEVDGVTTATTSYTTTTALQAEGVKNYVINGTNAFTHGYQNVYQRPFTLKLTGNKTELKVYQPLILTGGAVDASKVSGLLQLIKDNTYVDLYKGEGGLATKLGHTDSIIDLKINGTPTYDSTNRELTVNLVCGNDNYWMAPIEWKIKVDPSMITVSYGTLGKYSSSVTMYGIDKNGNNIGATDVTGKVWYEIYVEDTSLQRKYSNYKDLTPVVRVQMTKGSGTGVYVANYNSTPLSAGHYVMFAIAEDYTIIE